MLKIDILSVFPELFDGVFAHSIWGRASAAGHVAFAAHDIRAHTADRHRRTDDYPFGGGAGLVMTAQPILDAAEAVGGGRRLVLSARGRPFCHDMAVELASEEHLVLLCGHYEGIDQRAIDMGGFEEVSIGDYVLTGGELAACVLVDAVIRHVPGVLGNDKATEQESYTQGLLEYPQYTRPAEFRGQAVPEVLLSGHHANIAKWQRQESLRITALRRPDLLEKGDLTPEEWQWVRQNMPGDE